ncbi:hypothetical protein LAWI1_G005343 [Lachnellula willkommii]|uniref:Uncharacterized protein n=1 Tax=Lachnellula willkommii TaxID=215461 RepID=A0A559M0W6_9HELO|nr:hypothetical protein LAWI1_G005343 [Lachnellula willkommii]
MDFVNKAKNAMNSSGGGNTNTTQQPAQGQTGNASQEDYGDKGLDFVEKKSGHTMGRDTNEKITDGARNAYEKATGSTVNSKFSN